MAGGNDRSSAPDKGMGKLNLNATEFRPPPPAASQAPANHSGRAGAGKKGGKGSHGRTRAASDSRQRREDSRGEKDTEEGSEAGRGSGGRRGKGQGPRAVPRTKGGPSRTDATSGSSPKPTGDLAFSGSPTSSSGPGRRGVRADFLLNFTSPHRENLIGANTERARGGGAGRGGHGGRGAGSRANTRHHHHPSRGQRRSVYRKELFLQANFRFLVADWADLRGAATDPDHMVDWDDVVLVEMASADPLSCPVCLDEPMTCGQVTLCGHAFCFPCIARHTVSDRKEGEPAKCPMCFTPLRLADLRTVRRRPIDPMDGKDVVANRESQKIDDQNQSDEDRRKENRSVARLTLLSRHRDSAVPTPVRAIENRSNPACVDRSTRGVDWPRSSHESDGGACDLFAKYTLTADEALLGEEESGALEQRVAVMAAEGGAEATQELPYALLACDVMQSRLESWAEKRARALNLPPPSRGPSRKDAAAAAAAQAARAAAETRSMNTAFPALPVTQGQGQSQRRPPGMTAADWHDHSVAFLMGKAVEAASAFTDEDSDESESESEGDESEVGKESHDDGADEVGAAAAADMDVLEDVLEDMDPSASTSVGAAIQLAAPEKGGSIGGTTVTGQTRTEVYYFYQAEDGQPVVLHSACVRVLLAHHGGYDSLPLTLEAPIVELERHTQDEDTRRRAAHLRHLPLTTQYAIAELDMAALVPHAVLKEHGEELRRRETFRKRRANAERKAEAAAVAAEARERRAARVFSADKRGAMPDVRGRSNGDGSSTGGPGDGGMNGGMNGLTPEEALAMAREFAEVEEAVAAAEMAAAREAAEKAEGPRGASFSRVARWGFASGLDAPSLLPDVDSDAFGPALGAASAPAAPAEPRVSDGGGSGVWGAAARSVEPIVDVVAEEGRRRKGKKGTVLFEMGGARRY